MRTQKALYIITSLAFPAANYITLPLFIQSASVAEFGYYFLLLSVVNMASLLIGFGLVNTINAYYFYWSKTNSLKYNFANISFLVVAQFGLAAVALSLIYYTFIYITGYELPSFNLLLSIIFFAAMLYMKDMLTIFFRIDDKLHGLILLNIMLVILDTGIKIFYLKAFEFKIEYYLFLAAGAIFITYGLVHIVYVINNCFIGGLRSKKILVYYRYNLGMYRSNILGLGAALTDRPLVAILFSEYELGLYALVHRFSSTLSSARSLIKNIWIADALADISKGRSSNNNLKFLWGYGALTLIAILVVPFYAKFVLDLSYSFEFYALVFLFFIVNNLWIYYYFNLVFVIASKNSSHMVKVQLCASLAYFICLPLVLLVGLYAMALAQFFQIGAMILGTRYFYGKSIVTSSIFTRQAVVVSVLLIFVSLLVASGWGYFVENFYGE
jgi:hypothetical protein